MTRSALLAPLAVFLAALWLYLPTLNPAFRADDSPETVTAAASLGIQHPPGYPLHSSVGRLALFIPLGSPAWRLSLLAALSAALAAALCAALAQAWAQGLAVAPAGPWAPSAAGLVAGLGAASARGAWSQALSAKGGIYTLHWALLAGAWLALGAALRAREEPLRQGRADKAWALAALCLGLGAAQHWETQAVTLPALAVVLWGARQAPPSPQASARQALPWGRMALCLLPGLALYLYLPLRSAQSPWLDWGRPRDWDQFWWVLLRQEYLDVESGLLKSLLHALGGRGPWAEVAAAWQVVLRQGSRVLGHLAQDLGWATLPLQALGLGLCLRRSALKPWARSLGLSLCLLAVTLMAVVTAYFHLKEGMVWVLDAFLLPLYWVQALLLGLGAAWAWERWVPLRAQGLGWACLALGLPLGLAAWRAPGLSQAGQYLAYDYGKDFLLSCKARAVVWAEGDFNTMPVYYLQGVDRQRQDLDHLTTVFLSTDWGAAQAAEAHPSLGLAGLPKAATGPRQGDGALLRAVVGQVSAHVGAERPLQASLFREALAATVREWEPLWQPHGLAPVLAGPGSAWDERAGLGLLKLFRSRALSLDWQRLEESPSLALGNYGAAFLESALRLWGQGRTAEATPLFKRAVAWASKANRAEVLVHWGLALAKGAPGLAPDSQAGIAKFEAALAVKPSFEAYADLAAAHNSLGRQGQDPAQHALAEAAARQALALRPEPLAWKSLALALHFQGKEAQAQEALAQAQRAGAGR